MIEDIEIIAVAQMRIGMQADAFFREDIGKYVLGRCNQEILAGLLELTEHGLEDDQTNRKVLSKMLAAFNAVKWVKETLDDGRTAESQLYYNKEESEVLEDA